MNHRQLDQFNQENSLLIVAAYPARGTVHTGGGLASYTKNTLRAIKKANPHKKIVVLANIIDQAETYLEDGSLIVRCWKRQLPYPTLIKEIFRFSKIKNLLLEFEFATYGDLLSTALMPAFLLFLKLAGKKVTTVIHQAVTDLASLANHVGLTERLNLNQFFSLGLRLFYYLLVNLSHNVVALEKELASRLNSLGKTNKVVCFLHGLYPQKTISKIKARRSLNLDLQAYYVLAFGYLSHYKGSDLTVEAFQKPIKIRGKKVCLILAGGESPTQGQKPHYQGFYQKLYQEIDDNENIIHTGFVPDSRIKTYFSAADLVIFPYRTLMSASGPLSLALAYRKPFLVSRALNLYGPFSAEPTPQAFREAIISTLGDVKTMNKMKSLSYELALERHFKRQGRAYLDLIENRQLEVVGHRVTRYAGA